MIHFAVYTVTPNAFHWAEQPQILLILVEESGSPSDIRFFGFSGPPESK